MQHIKKLLPTLEDIKARDNGMSEKEITDFVRLLEMFIADCGLDRIEACKQAQKLLTLLNE